MLLFQRGATSWGFQIGRLYLYWPYRNFRRWGVKPRFGWEERE